jgi:anion-transporting  ArsA/GET3 family ATPase
MAPLDQRRFLFITGKGGAGKTTVTAALALALARRGRKVLIAMAETKERISTLLEVPPLGETITTVAPNVSAVKISPEVALGEYGSMVLKSRVVYEAVFDNKYVRSFFAAVPGLHQWAMLGKAWYQSIETDAGGRPRFDVVLFDAPATGHGLDMLRVPKVIVDVVPPGLLRRDAERAWAMFQNPDLSGVVVVTLPEDMPVNETIELAEVVHDELKLPIAQLVVNSVLQELFDAQERRKLLLARDLRAGDPGDEGLKAAARRATTERVQAESLDKLEAAIAAPKVRLPRLLTDVSTRRDVEVLAAVLSEALV